MKTETRPYNPDGETTSDTLGLEEKELFRAFDEIKRLATATEGLEFKWQQVKAVEDYIETLSTRQIAAALHYFIGKAEFFAGSNILDMLGMGMPEREGN
jgi:hypothetical protein